MIGKLLLQHHVTQKVKFIKKARWVQRPLQLHLWNTKFFFENTLLQNLEEKRYKPGQPNWEYTMWEFQDFSIT